MRIAIETAIQGGEVMFAPDDLSLLAWHESHHGSGTHFVVTARAFGSDYWGYGANLAWLLVHEYGHHTLYYPAGQEEPMADAIATKCLNFNAMVGY